MSKVAVKGNASGTGTFTIEAPNSNNNRTLTLPDAAGTIALQGGAGVGKVLQVVSQRYTANNSTTSTSFVATNITASITPTSTSSSILILVSANGWVSPSTNYVYATIGRNASVLGGSSGLTGLYGNDGTANLSFSYFDSPSTTASTVYTVYFRVTGGTGRITEATNGTSTITLMEIAA